MSPYAAGCATCGADLDPARWDTGPSRGRQVSSFLSSLSVGAIPNWVLWLILFALVALVYGII